MTTFIVVEGLSGVEGGFSFRSKVNPNIYLTRQNGKVVPMYIGTGTMSEKDWPSCTWAIKPGLCGVEGTVSLMEPGKPNYARHLNDLINVNPHQTTATYDDDASWFMTEPGQEPVPEPCPTGFTGVLPDCEDIDECALDNDCNLFTQNCLNNDGSYTCTCKQGLISNAGECVCPTGFSWNGNKCVDINECSANTFNCPSNAECNNTQGAYLCKCRDGFRLEADACVEVVPETKCPSDCWEYNESEEACTVKKNSGCYSLECDFDAMKIAFPSKLFDLVDNQTPNPFTGRVVQPRFYGQYWYIKCGLGECGMEMDTRMHDGAEHLFFSTTIDLGSEFMMLDGMKIWKDNSLNIKVTFECGYKQEVKVGSAEVVVRRMDAADSTMSFGNLDNGFKIRLYTDESFTTILTATNLYIGAPVFVSVDWAVTSLSSHAGFIIDECDLKFDDKSIRLIERNCYSSILGVKYLSSTKLVSNSSRFQFKSFLVGSGRKTMDFSLFCTVKMSELRYEKYSKLLSTNDSQCPNSPLRFYSNP